MKYIQLRDSIEIKNIIKENQLTNIIVETGYDNIFVKEENRFIVTPDFLFDEELVFKDCDTLHKIDMSNLDFSEITTMTEWFWGCTNLTEIVFPQMAQCKNITSLYGCFGETNINVIDLSFMNFEENLDEITFTKTFYNSKAKKVVLPKCKVEDLCNCFEKCYNLEEVFAPIIIEEFDEYTLLETFLGCERLKLINTEDGAFDPNNFIEYLKYYLNSNDIPKNCVIILPKKIESHRITRADEIRQIIKKNQLKDIIVETGSENTFISTENKFIVTKEFLSNESDVFSNCPTLKKVDMSNFNFTLIQSMNFWFYDCKNLQEIIFPQEADCDSLRDLSYCFANTSIDIIDLSFMYFDLDSVPLNLHSTFTGATTKKITLPKCNVQNMKNCFYWCSNLKEIIAPVNLDFDNNKKVLERTFRLCPNLKLVNFFGGHTSTIEFIEQLRNPDNENNLSVDCFIKLP